MEERRKRCWKKIVDEQIVIPANRIKIYDQNEAHSGCLVYHPGSVSATHSDSGMESFLDSDVSTVPSSSLLSVDGMDTMELA